MTDSAGTYEIKITITNSQNEASDYTSIIYVEPKVNSAPVFADESVLINVAENTSGVQRDIFEKQ